MTDHPMQNGSGFMRAIRAAKCSAQGLTAAWQNESAFRQELGLALLFVPLGIWLGQSVAEKLLLLLTVVIVLIVELLNSAIEACIDRIGNEYHELAGRAKDFGSAAVFIALIFTGVAYSTVAIHRFAG